MTNVAPSPAPLPLALHSPTSMATEDSVAPLSLALRSTTVNIEDSTAPLPPALRSVIVNIEDSASPLPLVADLSSLAVLFSQPLSSVPLRPREAPSFDN
ncbi:hypothetical protein BHE74_00012489 [Ensete ventricosum]|nr:hypothetical protein BHE74_00012489 [Ensete ventricosum]